MEISETINKWFKETLNKFTENISPKYPVDRFLLTSLLLSKKYILACLLLIQNDHKMPTTALLRVLTEFLMKLTWCLGIHESQEEDRPEKVEKNRKRWSKTTLFRRIREVERWKDIEDPCLRRQVQDQLSKLKKSKVEVEKDGLTEMPWRFLELLKELPKEYESDVYPRFYLKYNGAIHVDQYTLGCLVRKGGPRVEYYEDSQDETNDLLRIVSYYALMVNTWIRTYYGWDGEQMRKEGETIINQLSGKEV